MYAFISAFSLIRAGSELCILSLTLPAADPHVLTTITFDSIPVKEVEETISEMVVESTNEQPVETEEQPVETEEQPVETEEQPVKDKKRKTRRL